MLVNGSVPQTLWEFLERQATEFADRPALICKPRYRTETWSYRLLFNYSSRFAQWLRNQGVTRGDQVILWAPNSPLWVAAYFGVLRLGAILVPLDVRSEQSFVDRIMGQINLKMVLSSQRILEGRPGRANWWALEQIELPEVDGRQPPPEEVHPEDIAELMFTSGTTGDPKGVILTHRNILSNVSAVGEIIPIKPGFRLLSLLPLSHAFEQTVGLLLPLSGGGSIYYPSSRQSTEVFRAFREQGITMVLAVPQVLQQFRDGIERQATRDGHEAAWRGLLRLAEPLPMVLRKLLFYRVHQKLGAQLRFLVSGGAPLEPELAHRWELLGIPVLQGYGTTEASPVIAGTSFRGRKSGSVGKPISAVELKISEEGELLIRGPGVTQGYWHNPQATREAFRDGWYCTGDLGYLDSQGFLFLHGRRKDLIVLASGQNVYPEDIERVLKQVPGIADAVVLGVPSPRGDRVHAALICQSESEDVPALVRRANLQLASQQQIQDFSLWPDQEFPKTHTLKVKKQEVLQGILAAQTDLPLTGPGTAPRTREESPLWRVVANLAGVPEGDITKQTTLGTDLGLDSLARVDLLSAIEAEFGTYVDESQIDVDTTVGQLQELVNSQPLLNPPDFKVWPLTGWSRLIRGTLQAPLFLALSAVAPARVSGLQVLQDLEPPVLFAVNHTSHLDTPTLLRVLPRPWRKRVSVAAAADYFFTDSLLGAAVALVLNAFPFSRTTAIRPTLQHSAWLMDHGWSILIYPEGTRTNTGDIQSFKSGVGLLAVELGAPVVPIRTEGLFNILPKGQSIPRPGRVTVNVGPPIKFDRQISYEQATSIIERAVRDIHSPGSPAPEDRSTGNPPEIRE